MDLDWAGGLGILGDTTCDGSTIEQFAGPLGGYRRSRIDSKKVYVLADRDQSTHVMLVAAHKPAELPVHDFYLPIHVGHVLNPTDFGYQPDDDGDNISGLNKSYCELTAIYWAWRNLDAEVIGLSHYRRYFRGTTVGPNGSKVMSRSDAERHLATNDFVLGRRRHYVVETVESHYRNAHSGDDLKVLRQVVSDVSPGFLPAYDGVFAGRSLSLYNMFLTRRDIFDQYATWLFTILGEVAERVDGTPARTDYQQRAMGYLGERLLNVWVSANRELRVARVPITNVDGEPKFRKGLKLLARKAHLIDPTSRTA